jgi:glycerol-3-phosphate dehydrogenase (NAD(P)+)
MAKSSSNTQRYANIAVIGAGAWGTTLALIADSAGAKVTLWAREPDVVKSLRNNRENRQFLKGIAIPERIEATDDLARACEADALLLVSPAQHVRSMLLALKRHVPAPVPVVLCAKGVELKTGLLLPEVLAEVLPGAVAGILSGPSFARDVASGLPTAVTIAAPETVAMRLASTLGRAGFRPYVSEDVVGVALGGAAKNVYAIACGMVQGAGLGESARAATMSR